MKTTNKLFDSPQYQLKGTATFPIVHGKGGGETDAPVCFHSFNRKTDPPFLV